MEFSRAQSVYVRFERLPVIRKISHPSAFGRERPVANETLGEVSWRKWTLDCKTLSISEVDTAIQHRIPNAGTGAEGGFSAYSIGEWLIKATQQSKPGNRLVSPCRFRHIPLIRIRPKADTGCIQPNVLLMLQSGHSCGRVMFRI